MESPGFEIFLAKLEQHRKFFTQVQVLAVFSLNIKQGLSGPELLLTDMTSHILVLGRLAEGFANHIRGASAASQGLPPAAGLRSLGLGLGRPEFSV